MFVTDSCLGIQEGGHPDVVYITENVIAMGFPPTDLSSGLLGFVEVLHLTDCILHSKMVNL